MNIVTQVVQATIGNVWKMMLQTDIPGLNVSYAAFFISLIIIRFSIWAFRFISGIGGMTASDYGRAADAADKIRSRSDD